MFTRFLRRMSTGQHETPRSRFVNALRHFVDPERPHHMRLAMAALALLVACGAEPARPRQARPSTGNAHPAATSTSERPPLDCAECRPMLPYEDCGRHLEYDCPAPRSATCGISRLPDPCDPACCADAGVGTAR